MRKQFEYIKNEYYTPYTCLPLYSTISHGIYTYLFA
jgi:hypothetical protein